MSPTLGGLSHLLPRTCASLPCYQHPITPLADLDAAHPIHPLACCTVRMHRTLPFALLATVVAATAAMADSADGSSANLAVSFDGSNGSLGGGSKGSFGIF